MFGVPVVGVCMGSHYITSSSVRGSTLEWRGVGHPEGAGPGANPQSMCHIIQRRASGIPREPVLGPTPNPRIFVPYCCIHLHHCSGPLLVAVLARRARHSQRRARLQWCRLFTRSLQACVWPALPLRPVLCPALLWLDAGVCFVSIFLLFAGGSLLPFFQQARLCDV